MAVLSNEGFLNRIKLYLDGRDPLCSKSKKQHNPPHTDIADRQECVITVMGSSHAGKGKLNSGAPALMKQNILL